MSTVLDEWRITAIERKAENADRRLHEIDSLRSFVDRLEHTMRDLSAEVTWLRSQVQGISDQVTAHDARLRAERDELRAALENLVFTASKLWDDAKPIKDSAIIHATHPIIEQARAALSRTEGGEVGG